MSENQSASRIAADIVIAGFGTQYSFTSRDDRENTLIAAAIAKSFTIIHQAVLEAQQKEQAKKAD
jgi:hypothetical protein